MASEWDQYLDSPPQGGGSEWDQFLDKPPIAPAAPEAAPAPVDKRWMIPFGEATPARDTVRDIIKTTTSLPARGVFSMAGLPGLAEQAGIWATSKLTGQPSTSKGYLPTPESLMENARKAEPNLTVRDYAFHEPTTTGGKVVGFTEDLLTPSKLPGGSLNRADELLNAGKTFTKQVLERAPSSTQTAVNTRAAYKAAEDAGIHYDARSLSSWVDMLKGDIKNGNYQVDQEVTDLLTRLQNDVHGAKAGSGEFGLMNLDEYRKEAGNLWAMEGTTDAEASALSHLRQGLDMFAANAPTTRGKVSAAEADRLLRTARSWAQKNIRDKNLAKWDERGRNLAEDPSTGKLVGAEYSNKVRQGVRKELTNLRRVRGYSPEQQAALNKTFRAGNPDTGTRMVARAAGAQIQSDALWKIPVAGPAIGAYAGHKISEAIKAKSLVTRNRNVERELQIARALMRMNQADIPAMRRGTTSDIVRALLDASASAGMVNTD